jgi:hypothetical protein
VNLLNPLMSPQQAIKNFVPGMQPTYFI